jgi:hypothetical protein
MALGCRLARPCRSRRVSRAVWPIEARVFVVVLGSGCAACQNLGALDRCTAGPCDAGPIDGGSDDRGMFSDGSRTDGKGPAATYAEQVLASNPIAYYRLDEPAGVKVAHDSSGHGNDCSYSAGVVLGVPGAIGSDTAVRIAAQGAGVVCPTSLFEFSGSAPFSVEGWYAPDAVGSGYQSAFSRMAASPRTGFYVYLHAQPTPGATFEIWGSGDAVCGASGAPFPCPGGDDDGGKICGQFAYLVATYDGATLSVYVDGELGASSTCSGIPSGGDVEFTMGNFSGLLCDDCAMLGALDDVAVYDRALPQAEIRDHYHAAGF